MTPQEEPVWLGTLWNVDQSLAKMAEKYLAAEREKQFDLLDKIAIENEKKNQRIRELEESLKNMVSATGSYVVGPCYDRLEKVEAKIYNKAKQLLNQKP